MERFGKDLVNVCERQGVDPNSKECAVRKLEVIGQSLRDSGYHTYVHSKPEEEGTTMEVYGSPEEFGRGEGYMFDIILKRDPTLTIK